jgi:hypothetical protein
MRGAMQFKVTFSSEFMVFRGSGYCCYGVPMSRLGEFISTMKSTLVPGYKRTKVKVTSGGYHRTAIARRKPCAPIQKWLSHFQDNGRDRETTVLYYGVGRDSAGEFALRATSYDPYHPSPWVRAKPINSVYQEVHCHFVLNVVPKEEAIAILKDIKKFMTNDGLLILSVRTTFK